MKRALRILDWDVLVPKGLKRGQRVPGAVGRVGQHLHPLGGHRLGGEGGVAVE